MLLSLHRMGVLYSIFGRGLSSAYARWVMGMSPLWNCQFWSLHYLLMEYVKACYSLQHWGTLLRPRSWPYLPSTLFNAHFFLLKILLVHTQSVKRGFRIWEFNSQLKFCETPSPVITISVVLFLHQSNSNKVSVGENLNPLFPLGWLLFMLFYSCSLLKFLLALPAEGMFCRTMSKSCAEAFLWVLGGYLWVLKERSRHFFSASWSAVVSKIKRII